MSAFDDALAFTLRMEGGYSDDPADKGGATNQGITQRVYDHFRNGLNLPPRSVQDLTPEEGSSIYQASYWIPARCDHLSPKLGMVQFDSAVNHGVGRAMKFLQQSLDVDIDGLWGPMTAQAVQEADEVALIPIYLSKRIAFYQYLVTQDASQQKFLAGWLRRVEQLRAAVA